MMPDDALYLWLAIGCAVIGSYVWRALGVVISSRLTPDSAIANWLVCVTHALVAGLVTRYVVMDTGPLAHIVLWDKLAAIIAGVVIYATINRSVPLATIGAFVCFAAIAWWRTGVLS